MPATRASKPARAVWRAAASPGGLIGLLALLTCLAATVFLVLRVLPGQEAPAMRAVLVVFTAVLGALVLTIAYLLYGYFTLAYVVERQALTVRWGWSRYVIPLTAVEYVGPATQVLSGRAGASVPWPGYYLESYPLPEGGSVRTFATQPLHRQVVVGTAETLYVLSPERPVRFIDEVIRLRERAGSLPDALPPAEAPPARPRRTAARPDGRGETALPLDATQPLPTVRRAAPAAPRTRTAAPAPVQPAVSMGDTSGRLAMPGGRLSAPPGMLRDGVARALLALAGLIDLGLVSYIIWKLPFLPDRIPLHFNALGQVDRIGQPREIFVLPLIALGVLAVNALLAWSIQRYDGFAARLLLAGPVMTGLVAWVAAVNLL